MTVVLFIDVGFCQDFYFYLYNLEIGIGLNYPSS
jgi:hypothetical protein